MVNIQLGALLRGQRRLDTHAVRHPNSPIAHIPAYHVNPIVDRVSKTRSWLYEILGALMAYKRLVLQVYWNLKRTSVCSLLVGVDIGKFYLPGGRRDTGLALAAAIAQGEFGVAEASTRKFKYQVRENICKVHPLLDLQVGSPHHTGSQFLLVCEYSSVRLY